MRAGNEAAGFRCNGRPASAINKSEQPESSARAHSTEPRPVAPGENLERRLALDLLDVLESEAPGADPVVVGLALAAASRQREARP